MNQTLIHSFAFQRLVATSARTLAAGLALTTSTAWSAIIVDPSALNVALGDGANISTAVPGVTLSAPDNPTDMEVYTKDWAGPPQFTYDGLSFNSFTGGNRLQAVFDTPMTSVSVIFGVGGAPNGIVGWSGKLLAFDATNTQIDSKIMDFTVDGDYVLSVSGSIKYITATFLASNPATALDFVGLTRIEAVPEPGTVLSGLVMLGACAGFVLHRRRTPKA